MAFVSGDEHLEALISPTRATIAPDSKINILIAYNYCDETTMGHVVGVKDRARLLIDSGAFTAWKAGKTVDIQEYMDFITDLPIEPWGYFTLDVIGDPEATRVNYDIMRKEGLDPIPIFTRGEELSSMEYYFERSGRIALGGLVGTKGNRGFVNGLMKEIGDRKVHWLGFNYKDWLGHYRPHSCDSSSWSMGLRFGALNIYLGRGKMKVVNRATFETKPSPVIMNAILRMGVDPMRMAQKDEWHNRAVPLADLSALQLLTYRTWVFYQNEIERILGTRYFMAITAEDHMRNIIGSFNMLGGNLK